MDFESVIEAGVGYDCGRIGHLTASTWVSVCGNGLRLRTRNKGDKFLEGTGSGVGVFAVCRSTCMLAYAERGALAPVVHLHDCDSLARVASIEGAAALDVAALAFSNNGQLLATASVHPDHKLRLWDLSQTEPALLVESTLDFDIADLTFNPLNEHQLCASGAGRLAIFNVDRADKHYSVRRVDADFGGDFLTQSLRPHCHAWMPGSVLYVGCAGGEALAVRALSGRPVRSSVSGALSIIVTDDAAPITRVAATRHHVVLFTQLGRALWYTHAVDVQGETKPGAASLVHEEVLGMAEVRGVSFEEDHQAMLVGLADGSVVRIADTPSDKKAMPPAVATEVATELDAHAGAVAGLAGLPGGSHVVTTGEDGTLRVWSVPELTGGRFVLAGKRQFSSAQTCLVAATRSPRALVAIGGKSGVVRLVRCAEPSVPVVAYRARLHAGPVCALALSASGSHAASAGADGRLWLLATDSPTRGSAATVVPLGFIDLGEGADVASLAFTDDGALVGCLRSAAPEVFRLRPPAAAPRASNTTACIPYKLKAGDVDYQSFRVASALTSLVESPKGAILALDEEKTLCRYVLSERKQAWGGTGSRVRSPDERTPPVAEKPGTSLSLTADGAYVCVSAGDGSVTIVPLATGRLETSAPSLVKERLHASAQGGGIGVTLVAGGALVSAGVDGSILALTCEGSPDAKALLLAARSAQAATTSSSQTCGITNDGNGAGGDGGTADDMDAIDNDDEVPIGSAAEGGSGADDASASLSHFTLEANDDAGELGDHRAHLRVELQELRSLFQDILRTNESASDLERIDRAEIVVDFEAREALQRRGLERVAEARIDVLEGDARNEIVARRLVAQCYDTMAVQTRVVRPFGVTVADVAGGSTVAAQSGAITSTGKDSSAPCVAINELRSFGIGKPGLTEALGRKAAFLRRIEMAEDAATTRSRFLGDMKETETRDDEEREDDDAGARGGGTGGAAAGDGGSALDGRDGVLDRGVEGLLYGPYDLAPATRKRAQIFMLGLRLAEQRKAANESVDALAQRKAADIDRIAEIHTRCTEIVSELRAEGVEGAIVPVETPALEPQEVEGSMLSVDDSEIGVERFMSHEERARAAKEAADEAARMAAMSGDDPRERALKDMMGGQLVGNGKGGDAGEAVDSRPEWMEGDRSKMTDEQIKELAAWEAREAAAADEREKRVKALESELKKLSADAEEVCIAFDSAQAGALAEHAAAEAQVAATELSLLQLAVSVERETEADAEAEVELVNSIERLTRERKSTSSAVSANKDEVDALREDIDVLVAEDRALERSFKRAFADTGEYLDVLYKLFKRRGKVARVNVNGMPVAGATSNAMGTATGAQPTRAKHVPVTGVSMPRGARASVEAYTADAELLRRRVSEIAEAESVQAATSLMEQERAVGSQDPFAEALVAAKHAKLVASSGDSVLEEVFDRPEGCEQAWWDRLVDARQRKLDTEAAIREQQAILADKLRHAASLSAEDDRVRGEVEAASRALDTLRQGRAKRARDQEVPLRVKQGQVETWGTGLTHTVSPAEDTDALLLERTVVEDLNCEIESKHGTQKLDILSAIKDFKRGIYELEWANQSLEMRTTDAVERLREFQLMRVTRQLQELVKGGEATTSAPELAVLESRLEHNRRLHEKKVGEKRRLLQRVARSLRDTVEKNNSIHANAEDLERSVEDQSRAIEESTTKVLSKEVASRRMRSLVTQRKLQDIGKAQAEEITFLRNELERLRCRTFPSFVGAPINGLHDDGASRLGLSCNS